MKTTKKAKKDPFKVKRSIKPKKAPPIYIVRAVNTDWEVSNGRVKFKCSQISDAFRAMFKWEKANKKTPVTRARRS